MLAAAALLFFSAALGLAETLYLPTTASELSNQLASQQACARQLAQILRAAELWVMDNADEPPPNLLALTNDFLAPSIFYCPANFRANVPTNWGEVDWSRIDYTWVTNADWTNPADVACYCTIHGLDAWTDGTVHGAGYRSGWPALVASPHDALATPGSTVRFELKVAPDAALPLSFQWRRSVLDYTTNVTSFRDPEEPSITRWVTNVTPTYVGTNLPGQTNLSLVLAQVSGSDSGFYSIAVSNSRGTALSRQGRLDVNPAYAGSSTNAVWSDIICTNNLRQLRLFSTVWSAQQQRLPHSLSEMTNAWGELMFGWPIALFCRADTNRVAPETLALVNPDDTSYEMPIGDWLNPFDVFCRCRAHGHYVSVDGTVMLTPLFKNIRFLPPDSVELTLRTFDGKENVLESSDDFINWVPRYTWGLEAAEVRFNDSSYEKLRFYRLRLQ